MGIELEFNPELALRDISHYKNRERLLEECIPEKLVQGNVYNFLKIGQRGYYLLGPVPLVKTKGDENFSRPLASIQIIDPTHLVLDGGVWTRGKYRVLDVFSPDDKKIHFEGYKYLG